MLSWLRRPKSEEAQRFTLFFTSDIHGSERCFLKFVNAAKFYNARVLILGGDLTGKMIVPIVASGDGHYDMTLLGRHERLASEAEVAEAEKRIRFNGFYPYHCDSDELARMEADPGHASRVFQQLMRESIERWIGLAEERLAGTGVTCLVIPGNDDDVCIDDALRQSAVVKYVDCSVVTVDGFQVLNLSYSNPTPWKSPRELPEQELDSLLTKLAAELDPTIPTIFNVHCPPYDSTLDRAPELREDKSVVLVGGQPNMVPVGSTAVRDAIDRYQPVVSLHGHIHECKGVTRIGRTLCINPGSSYSEGVLDGALVTLSDDRVVSYQLVRG